MIAAIRTSLSGHQYGSYFFLCTHASFTSPIIPMLRSVLSVASSAEISPTIRLARMTMIRSDNPMTSGSSEEIRITPSPCFANWQILW